MPRAPAPSLRRLPDGSLLQNRLLAALPRAEYDRILQYVRITTVTTGTIPELSIESCSNNRHSSRSRRRCVRSRAGRSQKGPPIVFKVPRQWLND